MPPPDIAFTRTYGVCRPCVTSDHLKSPIRGTPYLLRLTTTAPCVNGKDWTVEMNYRAPTPDTSHSITGSERCTCSHPSRSRTTPPSSSKHDVCSLLLYRCGLAQLRCRAREITAEHMPAFVGCVDRKISPLASIQSVVAVIAV